MKTELINVGYNSDEALLATMHTLAEQIEVRQSQGFSARGLEKRINRIHEELVRRGVGYSWLTRA